jgi:hypothetical protein
MLDRGKRVERNEALANYMIICSFINYPKREQVLFKLLKEIYCLGHTCIDRRILLQRIWDK